MLDPGAVLASTDKTALSSAEAGEGGEEEVSIAGEGENGEGSGPGGGWDCWSRPCHVLTSSSNLQDITPDFLDLYQPNS